MQIDLARALRRSGALLATLAATLVATAAHAHPGHGAPDIIHGLDGLASAPVPAGSGPLQTLALGLALAGVVVLLLGPVAAAAGRRLPAPLLRLSRPLGWAALTAAAALGLA